MTSRGARGCGQLYEHRPCHRGLGTSLACGAPAGVAPAPLIKLPQDLAPGGLLWVLLGPLASWAPGPFLSSWSGSAATGRVGRGRPRALRAIFRRRRARLAATPVPCSRGCAPRPSASACRCRAFVSAVFAGEMRVGTSQSAILLVSAEGVFRWPGARSDLVNIPRALGKGETPPLLASACRQRQPHPGGPRCRSAPLPR